MLRDYQNEVSPVGNAPLSLLLPHECADLQHCFYYVKKLHSFFWKLKSLFQDQRLCIPCTIATVLRTDQQVPLPAVPVNTK